MTYTLRRATSLKDLAIIDKMHRSTIEEAPPHLTGGAWPDLVEGGVAGAAWWIMWSEDGKAAAFCGIWPPLWKGRPCYLVRAGVLPDHRGQGLQKRMIVARLAYARKMGWTTAVTYTLCDNAASANSLIARGFRVYNPPSPKWIGEGVIYWKKNLE